MEPLAWRMQPSSLLRVNRGRFSREESLKLARTCQASVVQWHRVPAVTPVHINLLILD